MPYPVFFFSTCCKTAFNPRTESGRAEVEVVLSLPIRRLFIRDWVAITIIAALFLSTASTVWLVVERVRKPCPLYEEPEGLLSHAGLLLHDTDRIITGMIGKVVKSEGFDGKFLEHARKIYNIDDASFYIQKGENGRDSLRVGGLNKRQEAESPSCPWYSHLWSDGRARQIRTWFDRIYRRK